MVKKVVYSLLLVSLYSVLLTDVKHFIHRYWINTELLVFTSLFSFIIAIEVLVFSDNMTEIISHRLRRNIQRGIHLILAINSIVWKVIENKKPIDIVLSVLTFAITFGIVHSLIHKIQNHTFKTIS